MGNNIKIQKTVYTKDSFGKVVDREFKSFITEEEETSVKTVEQFFKDYEELYLDIPLEGEGKSHKYLIERSSELVEIQEALLDIQPLLDEIAELRDQLLEANKKVVDLEISLANTKAGIDDGGN
tara:strand:- start:69 stop:440 length:372 start_codon:yes stop_codon:yes gene_type:complete